MKKNLFFLPMLLVILFSCTIESPLSNVVENEDIPLTRSSVTTEDMDRPLILGARLENPYSVANMKLAAQSLLDKGHAISLHPNNITSTHVYVKFLPQNESELNDLVQFDIELFDFPLDYEILEPGNEYRQPGLADSVPNNRYASIEKDYWLSIKPSILSEYEIVENLYIPESIPITKSGASVLDEATIDMLVDESMLLTGNVDPSIIQTGANNRKWTPAGRIRAYDNIAKSYIPLKNAKIRVWRWFTVYKAYTDANGLFRCNGSFDGPAHYSIKWESNRWDIRDGHIGQANYNGPKKKGDWMLDINGGKSLRYATIHRALQRFYYGDTYGLSRPANSRKEKIAYLHRNAKDGRYGDYNRQWGLGVWSDIRVFGYDKDGNEIPMSEVLSTTFHELGHAAHYTNATYHYKKSNSLIIESWARCVQYHLTNKEYDELGVRDLLYEYEDLVLPIEHMEVENNGSMTLADFEFFIPVERWRDMKPDYNYNFQAWHIGQSEYSPIFIDLTDDYNQRKYFKAIDYKNNYRTNYAVNHPEDFISEVPISEIENMVFSSHSLGVIKMKLKNYAIAYPMMARCLTEKNINTLFESYE